MSISSKLLRLGNSYLRILLCITVLLVLNTSLCAQNSGISQLNSEVQLLSEQQLSAFWTNAKSRGYTLRTVPELLRSSGYSFEEAERITERLTVLEQSTIGEDYEGTLNSFEQRIYGLSIFEESFNFTDYNSLPTPSKYQMGANDILGVVLYGETDASYTLTVDKEGKVRLPFIGPFTLQGLTFDAAKSLIKQKLVSAHAGLAGPNPSVFMDVTLVNARSITVSILGEVERPGYYAVPSTSDLFSVLYRAGGPTPDGTLRQVKVFRSNQLIGKVDLYRFINEGFVSQDITFQDQDIIVLGAYEKRVELKGFVKKPGIYELNNEKKLANLINFAGGFQPGADSTSVVLKRLKGREQQVVSIGTDYDVKNLMDGDIIEVVQNTDYVVDKIEITGAVNRPGVLNYESGMTLADALSNGGGLRGDAIKGRISIFQLESDLRPTLKTINLEDIDPSTFKISDRSLIYVPSMILVAELGYVSLQGAISKKGELPFFDGMTLLDALVLSEGVDESAYGGNIELVRLKSNTENLGFEFYDFDIPEKVENFDELDEITLMPNDRIFVRSSVMNRKQNIVDVRGEIFQTGEFVINPGVTKVSEVIERSGSYLKTANLRGLKLYRKVQTLDDESDSVRYERKKSISEFVNDSRFEGAVSKLQFDASNQAFDKLKGEREMAIRQSEYQKNSEDSISVLNNFRLSKSFLIQGKQTELLEIGLSFDQILEDPNSIYNVTLLDGDILYMPPKSSLVEIDGNVFRPTQAIYKEKKTFKEYIETAGGYRRLSDKRRAYIEYSNGEIKKVRGFLFFKSYPKVESDSRIIVPAKPPGQRINYERIIALLTTTISTYLLVESVTRSN